MVRRPLRLELREESVMIGLYDGDGVLRFMGSDAHACEAYALLFGLPLANCSLIPMPRPQEPVFKKRRSRRQAASSN